MLALPEGLDHLITGRGEIDRYHIEPGRHDLVHPRVRQREHAEQHVALRGAEIGLEGTPGGDETV